MKKFLALCFFTVLSISAQDNGIKKYNSRISVQWETVRMKEEPDMGFMTLGYDLLFDNTSWGKPYVGVHTLATMTGIRPGLITLGVKLGMQKDFHPKWYADYGVFIGAGGGGAADDGSGFVYRPHLLLGYRLSKQFDLNAGVSRIDFPTGNIKDFSLLVGLNWNVNQYLMKAINSRDNSIKVKGAESKQQVHLIHTTYFNFDKLSTPRAVTQNGQVSLLGIQAQQHLSDYLRGLFKISGAYSGGADGYMSIFMGLGWQQPVLYNRFNLKLNALFGTSGGGAIEAGGGATAQIEAGLGVHLKNYELSVTYGKTFAPEGPFGARHIQMALGKYFSLWKSKKEQEGNLFQELDQKAWERKTLKVGLVNKSYINSGQLDLNGNPYLDVFQLLGFEFELPIHKNFSLMGATNWAYEGNYGAYAEGLLGLKAHVQIKEGLNAYTKTFVGAAGGGGIDVGKGLMAHAYAGLSKSINQKFNLTIGAGKVWVVQGNFNPTVVELGFNYTLNQLVKNR